jgi:hypothetical protein
MNFACTGRQPRIGESVACSLTIGTSRHIGDTGDRDQYVQLIEANRYGKIREVPRTVSNVGPPS